MKKLVWLSVLVMVSVLLQMTPVQAVSLSFVPAFGTIGLGGTAAVDIVISGLGDHMAPSVGAFDLDVTYDPTILTAIGVTFGACLGDLVPPAGACLGDPSLPVPGADVAFAFLPGLVDLAEASIIFEDDLHDLQPAAFTLARLVFTTAPPAQIGDISPLTFVQTDVVDAAGNLLAVTVDSGQITVVPEPGTFVLLSLGLAGLLTRRMVVLRNTAPVLAEYSRHDGC
jgi:hypothetical protein